MINSTQDNPNIEPPLDSWKEIAAYLQRDVRTLMRWEKHEGLPVHRHHHLSRASVYAYPSELEAWRAGRSPEPAVRGWWRPVPAFASTITIALALMMAGSGPHVGGLVQAADGIVTRQVWTGPWTDARYASPSPDGKYLSFADWETGGNLAVREVAAGTKRLLTEEGDYSQCVLFSRWSPDATRLAYDWFNKQNRVEVRLVGFDGSGARTLFDGGEYSYVWTHDWSPDGKYLLAGFFREGEKACQLGLISVTDGSVRIIKDPGSKVSVARFSPDGRYIAYELVPRRQSPERDIHIVSADGKDSCPLVEGPTDDFAPAWSPDGRWVVFGSDRAGAQDLWAVPVSEGKPAGEARRLKQNMGQYSLLGLTRSGTLFYGLSPAMVDAYIATVDFKSGRVLDPPQRVCERVVGSCGHPHWSPDGGLLLHRVAGRTVIRSLETGRDRDVSLGEYRDAGGFRWSPDGRSLLIGHLWKRAFCRVDLESGQIIPVKEIEPLGDIRTTGAQWTPDGEGIVYWRRDARTKTEQILRSDLGTGRETELYRRAWDGDGNEDHRLAYSPDGQWLAFVHPSNTLKIMPASGGQARELLTFRDAAIHTIAWTRDGNSLIFADLADADEKSQVWLIAVGGGEPRKLDLPVEGAISVLDVHPDGRRLAYSSRTLGRGEIWAMENFLPGSADAGQ